MSKLLFATAFILSMALMTNPVRAEESAVAEKEWTFLLFLNGHNNLDSYGAMNINQMEEVGSTDRLNMVVQWASLKNKQTKRLLVLKDKDTNKVTSPAVETLAPVDMGDYKQLVEFIRWGVKNYPAKHYMVAVWNHGAGWHRVDTFGNRVEITPNDISWDDHTGHKITTEELGVAMAEAKKIIGHNVDIYGSDACLMGMAEVAAEMDESVDYFVGAQETEPGQGWPYNTWMTKWAAAAEPTGADVSKFLVDEYLKAYSGGVYGNQDVTLSAYDMSKFPAYLEAMKNFNTSLANLSPGDITTAKTAANNTQEFYYSDYKDIYDFVDRLEGARIGVEASVMATLKQTVSELVIANGASPGQYSGAHGLSVWLPTSAYYLNSYKARYNLLKFNKATGWVNFLTTLNK